jgi:hypothetical protein
MPIGDGALKLDYKARQPELTICLTSCLTRRTRIVAFDRVTGHPRPEHRSAITSPSPTSRR